MFLSCWIFVAVLRVDLQKHAGELEKPVLDRDRADRISLTHYIDLQPPANYGHDPVSYTHLTLPTNREV